MLRNDPKIVLIQEFESREADAGVAVGCVVWKQGDSYVFHSFYHEGGSNSLLHTFWGHYDLTYEKAFSAYMDRLRTSYTGYRPYVGPEDPRTVRGLVEAVTDEYDPEPQDLDDLVHDVFSEYASNINNSGVDVQIGELLRELGEDEVRRLLADLKGVGHD